MIKSSSKHAKRAALVAGAMLVWPGSLGGISALAAPNTETEAQSVIPMNGQIVFSTDYPGVSVAPGDNATFSLYLTNGTDTESDVALTAEDLPDGWTGYFRGSDSVVSSVHLSAAQSKDNSPTLTYNLTIPDDAKEGTYPITLSAQGDGVDTEAVLSVTITKEETGESAFSAKYAEQQGASDTSFSFDTTLTNSSASSASYNLSSDAPEGWTVSFTPSGASSAVTSLPIDAGSTQNITVAIDPADTVTKGDYTINLTAKSATEELTLPLTVSITGTYGLTLSTPTGNLNASAYAGEEKKVSMTLTNSGNIDLTGINLSGTGSTDWEVSFDQPTVDSLKAGESVDVTAVIKPAENAIIGDYVTQVSASNDAVKSDVSLRISVKNHTTWGIVSVAVIAALLVCLGAIIHKFGRR